MAVADFLRRFARPAWRWSHFPAGEARDVPIAAKLKRMGTQRGWPDFILMSPDAGRLHAVELKRLGEGLSADQEAFRQWCFETGGQHIIAKTLDEAIAALSLWGVIRVGIGGGNA
jgi:hypothetical protein